MAIELPKKPKVDPTVEPVLDTPDVPMRGARVEPTALDTAKGNLMGALTKKADTTGIETTREAERKSTLGMLDTRIQEIDFSTQQKVDEARARETESLGQARGINIRSGLAGSNFASARTGGIKAGTEREIAARREYGDIQKQKAQGQVDDALIQIEERARQRIEDAQTANVTLLEKGVDFLEKDAIEEERIKSEAMENLKTLANSGTMSFEDVRDSGILEEMLQSTGRDEADLELMFNASKPKESQIQWEDPIFSDGKVTYVGFDPVSETITKVEKEMDIPVDDMEGKELEFKEGQWWFTDLEAGTAVVIAGGKVGVDEEVGDESVLEQSKIEAGNDTIELIDDLIVSDGLNSAVGSNVLGRFPSSFFLKRISFDKLTGKTQEFIAGVEKLVSQFSLDALVEAKARGATFGALSDSELRILASSATKIGTWKMTNKKGEVIGYNVSEKAFKEELEQIKIITNRAIDKFGTQDTVEDVPEETREFEGQSYRKVEGGWELIE